MKLRNISLVCACALALAVPFTAVADDNDVDIGQLYTGENRVQQTDIANMSRDEIRLAGMRMFTYPFLTSDGFGDGNDGVNDGRDGLAPTGEQGKRGSLQGVGTFQRIGGLDAQTCLECHSVVSRRTVPMKFGIGGVGGVNSTVLGAGGNTFVDLNLQGRSSTLDSQGGTLSLSQRNLDGRVINPPFIFGAGGVEVLANEMTVTLQEQVTLAGDDETTPLTAKGISFGTITKVGGVIVVDADGNAVGAEGTFNLDPTSSNFLVVAPFGRRGSEKSSRTFDTGAMAFHFGMEVGPGDNDNDGVSNEVTEGEMSALSIFVSTTQTPFIKKAKGKGKHQARRGRQIMGDIGCTVCHVAKMETTSKFLGFRSPEIAQDPSANVFITVDLTKKPMRFKKNDDGGITVDLYGDLKRHQMGTNLAEFDGNRMFTTTRLWGVADTAPYLHDGRALTIKDAIVMHGLDGSDAGDAVATYNGMSGEDKNALLAFLDTLRSPDGTFKKLLKLAKKLSKDDDDE